MLTSVLVVCSRSVCAPASLISFFPSVFLPFVARLPKMGAAESRPLPPWFSTADTEYPQPLSQAIQSLSSTAHPFLSGSPHYYAPFELDAHLNRLQGALEFDRNISSWYPKLVPKRVSETEFWRNYFSHVAALVTEAHKEGQLEGVAGAAEIVNGAVSMQAASEEYRRGAQAGLAEANRNATTPSSVDPSPSSSTTPASSTASASVPASASFPFTSSSQPSLLHQQSKSPANNAPHFQAQPVVLPVSLLPANLPLQAPAASSSPSTLLRWGVIGCGRRARTILPLLAATPNAQIVAVARASGWKASLPQQQQQQNGTTADSSVSWAGLASLLSLSASSSIDPNQSFRLCHSVESLLAEGSVDAVYVCTPTGTHAWIADLCSRHHKPLVLDGPLARSAFEAAPLLRSFAQSQTPLYASCGGSALFADKSRAIQAVLQSKKLGELRSVNVEVSLASPSASAAAAVPEWRSNAEQSGGGVLMETASQLFQLLDALIGPLTNVHGDAVQTSASSASASSTENLITATFRAAGRGLQGSAASASPILCTVTLSAAPASSPASSPSTAAASPSSPSFLFDKLVFVGTNARLSTSAFGVDAPHITYTQSNQATEIRITRAAKSGEVAAVECAASHHAASPSPIPSPIEAGLVPFIRAVSEEIRLWKASPASLFSSSSSSASSPSSLSSLSSTMALRSCQVLDAVLRDFYRDRSDQFWERPGTWKH